MRRLAKLLIPVLLLAVSACSQERYTEVVDVQLLPLPSGDLVGEATDLVEWPGSVGVAPGVPDVDQVLVGEEVDQRPCHGEAPEAAVEHADGSGIHGRRGYRRGATTAGVPPGPAR